MSGKAKKRLRSVQTAVSFAIGLSSDNSDDIDLFRDLDGNLVLGEAVSADENLELAGLDNILFLCIPIAELLFGKLKRNGFLLAGLVILLYKALELAYGSGYLSNAVVDIALRCLLPSRSPVFFTRTLIRKDLPERISLMEILSSSALRSEYSNVV